MGLIFNEENYKRGITCLGVEMYKREFIIHQSALPPRKHVLFSLFLEGSVFSVFLGQTTLLWEERRDIEMVIEIFCKLRLAINKRYLKKCTFHVKIIYIKMGKSALKWVYILFLFVYLFRY